MAWLSGIWPLAAAAEREVELRELAPGVYAKIVPDDYEDAPPREQIGTNQGIVVQDDGVLVIDPSYAFQARWLADDIAGLTTLPVRRIFITHFHPDHSRATALLATRQTDVYASEQGRRDFDEWLSNLANKELRAGTPEPGLRKPNQYFDAPLVLGEGATRVELIPMGGAHADGDAVAWLPEHGVLFSGDLCKTRPGIDGIDSAAWVVALERLRELPVKVVVPGHGPIGGRELLDRQYELLVELRGAVKAAIDSGTSYREFMDTLELESFTRWNGTSIQKSPAEILRIYKEFGGDPRAEGRRRKLRFAALGGVAAVAAGLLVALWRLRRRRALAGS